MVSKDSERFETDFFRYKIKAELIVRGFKSEKYTEDGGCLRTGP
jgi:hypothetical protein